MAAVLVSLLMETLTSNYLCLLKKPSCRDCHPFPGQIKVILANHSKKRKQSKTKMKFLIVAI